MPRGNPGVPYLDSPPDRGCWIWPRCTECPLPVCWFECSDAERRTALHAVRRALGQEPPLSQSGRSRKRQRQRAQRAIRAGG